MENTKENPQKYAVLLYYVYTNIADPDIFREQHHLLCLSLNLRGRIIIANEGLNGTVAGFPEDCEAYMQAVKQDERFKDVDFKVEYHHENPFQKLYVRVKPEIVHLGLPTLHPKGKSGKYVAPKDFKAFTQQEDVVILDVRSNYEHNVGKFKNAITLDIENFRDFPQKVEELSHLKNKKIVTYCTGGIKCEKATAYLLEQGFEDVYQLHGGIVKHGLEAGGEDFEGKCYVFDGRLVVNVNQVNPSIVSKCFVCGTVSDRMVNCANTTCNEHVPICEKCGEELQGACSETCKNHPEKRPYNGTGYYQKELNGYDPYLNATKRK